ncbi:MAG: hypothetical protein ACTSU4_00640 [Promethearchaeota archaeon]
MIIQDMLLYSTMEISKLITQGVLLLAATREHFFLLKMSYKQIEVLKNVRLLIACSLT